MKIKNIDGIKTEDLELEVKRGGRFVYFPYTVSFLVVTLKRNSGVYLLRDNENAAMKGLPFIIISVLFGWWGIPFGPKYTIESIRTICKGGKDVTDEVMATVAGHILFKEVQMQKNIQL
ncbi:MAG: hypothetical protein IPP43_11980 [Chitinophagaceae bacterium]|nr:hypothetical protein [Chitinophagaceae bacterium]MBL0131740.1 hypothetical protein [Chitinophagaceae bacterium]MBL0272087.1 hypothetical protein [Chitinophagaceae bacterium]